MLRTEKRYTGVAMFHPRQRASGALRRLVDAGSSSADIADLLNGFDGPQRVLEAMSIGGSRQGRLYDALADAEPLALDDIVPEQAPPSATIMYQGRNSMPLFDRFQKRFARLPSGTIVGYNHQLWSPLTGPGYFQVKPASDQAAVRGEPYFDYTAAPGYQPTGWPAYRPNEWGFSLVVYAHMHDYMRRVADGVMIGKAYKRGKPAGQYFILARAD